VDFRQSKTCMVSHGTPLTPEQWGSFWNGRYADTLRGKELTERQRLLFGEAVESYLARNPGNPRRISIGRMNDFIVESRHAGVVAGGDGEAVGKHGIDRVEALLFFYDDVARSEPHAAALRRILDNSKSVRADIGRSEKGRISGGSGNRHTTDWPSVWIESAVRQLMKEGNSEHAARESAEGLRPLLSANACHPREIPPDSIRRFLSESRASYPETFDTTVAAAYALYRRTGEKSPEESRHRIEAIDSFLSLRCADLLDRFVACLQLNGSSRRTIAGYVREVRRYLDRLPERKTVGQLKGIHSGCILPLA